MSPTTGRLEADEPGFAHHHHDLPGVWNVTHPLLDPGVHPRRHHPTPRATVIKINRLNLHSATA
jgi:hypothetical protein